MIMLEKKDSSRRSSFGWSQSGLTIVEMVMAIAISSILGIGMMKIFSANRYLFSGEKTAGRTFTNARLVMEELTRSLRMINYNPQETTGGVFGIKQCSGSVGAAFTNTAIAAGMNSAIYFTRDYNENGALNFDNNDMVGYKWNAATNTLQYAIVDAASGNVSSWVDKYPNVTSFIVDYQYYDGSWASVTGMPDPAVTTRTFAQIAAISISITMRSERPHELTRQWINETINTTIMIRNKYYS
jgi:type II secretory pathway component PulJ